MVRSHCAVAVIDSGVQPIGDRVIEAVDFTSDGGAPVGHGTAVATTILEIVPQARIVSLRVMDRYGALEKAELLDTAFDWIAANHARLGVRTVCAAFADTSHSQSDAAWQGSALQRALRDLRSSGVAVVGAAGNWYPEHRRQNPHGMAWPAILREIVSVGELERGPDGRRLSRVTQRLHASCGTGCATTVFSDAGAPGETSGAAAVVAGRLAALRCDDPDATVDALVDRLVVGATLNDAGFDWPVAR